MPRRPHLPVLALASLLTLALAQGPAEREAYEVPGDDTFPEGIAYHAASHSVYVSGAGSGAIYRIDLETGAASTLLEPGSRPAFTTIGLAIDGDRLWVAGGSSGAILRFDLTTRMLDAVIMTPATEATFINDLVVAPNGDVFATDSHRPVLFRVPAGNDAAERWLDFTGTAFEYSDGFNANGIAVTDDGAYLFIVASNTGRLYRVGVADQEVVRVDLAGYTLTGGDGLVLDGSTLYVVQNGPDRVAVVELQDDGARGVMAPAIEDARLTDAATAALVDGHLLVTNAQFSAMQSRPELPFTVSVVPLPR